MPLYSYIQSEVWKNHPYTAWVWQPWLLKKPCRLIKSSDYCKILEYVFSFHHFRFIRKKTVASWLRTNTHTNTKGAAQWGAILFEVACLFSCTCVFTKNNHSMFTIISKLIKWDTYWNNLMKKYKCPFRSHFTPLFMMQGGIFDRD